MKDLIKKMYLNNYFMISNPNYKYLLGKSIKKLKDILCINQVYNLIQVIQV